MTLLAAIVRLIFSLAVWAAGFAPICAAEFSLDIDLSRTNGIFRPLHGMNKGPLLAGGLMDLSSELRPLAVPSVRLHDCHWPNPEVVDIHVIFPNFDADPRSAESYEFKQTDAYIGSIINLGAKVIYPLGESIEHTEVKRYVHPPRDFEKWAAICEGMVRHYNEGWAEGFQHNIRYWEIWNEPENRPAMWSGSDEDYFRLYEATARRLKKRWPELKIGGPAVGAPGTLQEGELVPSTFVRNFLQHCRSANLPLDFFSWHCYSDEPREVVIRARGIRKLLDETGFTKTEVHLNEWNYLPGNSWKALSPKTSGDERAAFYSEMSGANGARFILETLLLLQDAPITQANLFHGEAGPFGLFDEYGRRYKNYFGVLAFKELLDTSRVLLTNVMEGGITLAIGKTASEARIAITHSEPGQGLELKLRGVEFSPGTLVTKRQVTASTGWSRVELAPLKSIEVLRFNEPGITFLTLPITGN
jgi:xylan 1,4-beta-xylosidase